MSTQVPNEAAAGLDERPEDRPDQRLDERRDEGADPRSGTAPAGVAAMPAGRLPRRTGGIALLGILLALLALVVGVLAVRDALAYAGVLDSQPLLHSLAARLQGMRPEVWVVVLGAVLALLGLALLFRALRPSAPKVIPVVADSGVYLRPRDVTRLVETVAEDVDGVLAVNASTTPRRVNLTIRSTGDPGVAERTREAVSERLQPLATRPTVRVRTERQNR
ncbi:MAG: DUF6286 domain-containing protein [Terrabacter sp.]